MGTIGRRSAYYQVCLVQCLQIVLFQAAAYHNHRVSVAGKDEVHHQSGYTSVAVLERVDADVAVVKLISALTISKWKFIVQAVQADKRLIKQALRFVLFISRQVL